MNMLPAGGGKWTWMLLAVYFLSGVTGVAYEVLWVRMLSIQFGASNFGVVVILVAFMFGLGAGGLLGAWYIRRFSHPLLIFALLEGAVALFALALPWVFGEVNDLLSLVAADAPLMLWFLLQGVVSFMVLFVPAAALGVGFPLVLRYFENTPVSIASVYGLNTLGGATGAVVPLLLLPAFGWTASIQAVAGLGLFIALVTVLVAVTVDHDFGKGRERMVLHRPTGAGLLFYAGIGAAALMLQVGWTRMYGMILLRTEYVLAIILCLFLVGIGLGSLLARRIPQSGLTWFPIVAGGSVLFSLAGLPLLAAWVDGAEFASLGAALGMQGLALALLTLPTTLILGAWLPLLSLGLGAGGNLTAAWLYGANAVGAALGALIGGFLLIPSIGTPATICIAALLLFLFGMSWSGKRWLWLGLPVLAGLAWPVSSWPEVNRLLPGLYADSSELALQEDALSITHVIERQDGQRVLLSDLRRMEASTDPAAVAAQKNMARLPLILHPDPESVLLLGLGTGITAAGTLAIPELSAVSVELSAGAIAAAREHFSRVNDSVTGRIAVVHDDVRRFLRSERRRHDVIIGDLFHPDLVGRSNLLSVQQFRRVRESLAEGGIFVQWLAMNQFDSRSLEIVMRSFQRVFPGASLYIDGFRIALVGMDGDRPDISRIIDRFDRLDAARRRALTGGEGLSTWLGRYWGEIDVDAGPVQDEWAPKIEFSLPRARYDRDLDLGRLASRLLVQRPSVERAADQLDIPEGQRRSFDAAYIATELAVRSWVASLRDRPSEAVRLIRLAYEANPRDRWIGYDLADRMYTTLDQGLRSGLDRRAALETILEIRPDHVEAIHALWKLEKAEGNIARAIEFRDRLREVAPLDRRLPKVDS